MIQHSFHHVGHGLFYTANYRSDEEAEAVHVIYDCGLIPAYLKTNLESRILSYYLANGHREIDMLILSHLHFDHVGGVQYLLDLFDRIKVVVMPYLSPLERLMASAAMLGFADDWYIEFAADPVSYLLNTGKVDEVILLGPGDTDLGESPQRRPNLDDHDDYRKASNLTPDTRYFSEILRHESPLEQHLGKLSYQSHDHPRRLEHNWAFHFYNHPIPEARLRTFANCLASKKIRVDTPGQRLHALTRQRNDLRQCYAAIRSDINWTSLAVTHGIDDQRVGSGSGGYHMLTGDLDLHRHRDYKDFFSHYERLRYKVELLQVPHHGADSCWNEKLGKDFPHVREWVVSARAHDMMHPGVAVRTAFAARPHKLKIYSEYNDTSIILP